MEVEEAVETGVWIHGNLKQLGQGKEGASQPKPLLDIVIC